LYLVVLHIKSGRVIFNLNTKIIDGIISDCKNKTVFNIDEKLRASSKEVIKCNSLDSITPEKGFNYVFANNDKYFPEFIEEYKEKLSKQPIHTIVYEEDKSGIIDYTPVNTFLEENNYKCSGDIYKTCIKQNNIN
jgi:hypothetical protein